MEKWKWITGYEGLYEVSDMGRIKAAEKIVFLRNGGYKAISERIMQLEVMKLGYLRVQLSKKGVTKKILVHVLVAQAFVPNPNRLPEVNHIDGIKSNCAASNLEWTTKSSNILHSYHVLGRKKAIHKNIKKVQMLSADGTIKVFESMQEAARHVGTNAGNIHSACNGKIKTLKDCSWTYA